MHKLIEASVFAAIGVLVFASLLIPIVDDSTATTSTFENQGIYYIVNDSETHILVFENQTLTVDGEIVSHPLGEYTVLATNDILFRLTTGGERLQLRGALNGSVVSCSVTISEGNITGTYVTPSDQTVTINRPYTTYWLATIDKEPLIMKSYDSAAYVVDDSVIMGRGLTRLMTGANTDVWEYLIIDATVGGNVSISPVEGFTYSDVALNITPVNGYDGLYSFGSITFKAIHTETGTVTNVTYTAGIVPAEVTAEKSIHADEPTREVLEIMPLILIAGLIIGVLGYAVYSRIE